MADKETRPVELGGQMERPVEPTHEEIKDAKATNRQIVLKAHDAAQEGLSKAMEILKDGDDKQVSNARSTIGFVMGHVQLLTRED